MGRRSQHSIRKRQRELKKHEKQQQKREKKLERKRLAEAGELPPEDLDGEAPLGIDGEPLEAPGVESGVETGVDTAVEPGPKTGVELRQD